MLKRNLFILMVLMYSVVWGKEYSINMKSGWQLIGLPADTENMRLFNRSDVRLVWSYNSEYNDWEGFSPETSVLSAIDSQNINRLNRVKRWQGLWVFSYNNWTLTVSESNEPSLSSQLLDSVTVSRGWNLLSIPFNAVISPKVLSEFKIWKYDRDSQWQTNRDYTFFDFPEVDELNSKRGFWLYSPEERTVDLAKRGGELLLTGSDDQITSSFTTLDSVHNHISKTLVINNREQNYWNWSESIDIFQTDTTVTDSYTIVSNGITNGNSGFEKRYNGVEIPDTIKEYNEYIFYKQDNSVRAGMISRFASNDVFTPKEFKLEYSENGQLKTSSLKNFAISGGRLISFSTINDTKISPSFAERCREKKSAITIHDLNLNPIGYRAKRDIFIDGEVNSSRLIDNSLYVITKFEPCVELQYPRVLLQQSDSCFNPEDTADYRARCYDVKSDENGTLYRYNYEYPDLKESYLTPKYSDSTGVWQELIKDPKQFYASSNLAQNSDLYTVSQFNIESGKLLTSLTVMGEMDLVKFTESSIYFTSSQSPHRVSFEETTGRTDIHKFYFKYQPKYVASTELNSSLIDRFSLDESSVDSGVIRVASRSELSTGDKGRGRIDILKDKGDGTFDSLGTLQDIVDYRYFLEGVKFYDDIAVASSESANKPLYLIDLSDLEAPRKSGGSITLNGKNSYIHYSTDDKRLFLVGQEVDEKGIDGGVTLRAIDVEVIDTPVELASRTIGDYHNFSPVYYSGKTFGYKDSRVVLPIQNDGNSYSPSTVASSVYSYRLESDESGNSALIRESAYSSDSFINSYDSNSRVLFMNYLSSNYILYLNNGKLFTKRIAE